MDRRLPVPTGRGTQVKRGIALVILGLASLHCIAFLWWALRNATHDTGASLGVPFGWREAPVLPNTDRNHTRRLDIVICAKVSNEIPYLLEWIEFHRMQGVQKFVLYHDAVPTDVETSATAMQLHWLPTLYREVEERRRQGRNHEGKHHILPPEDVVDVLPVSLLVPDLWDSTRTLTHGTLMAHRTLQMVLMEDCVERYKDRADYILHIDIDEFVYAPKHASLLDYLRDFRRSEKWKRFLRGRTFGIYIPSVNFGSSGTFWDFHNTFVPDASSGTVRPYFDPRDASLPAFLQDHLKSNNQTSHDPPANSIVLSQLPQELMDYRLRRLYEAAADVPLGNAEDFIAYVARKLQQASQSETDSHVRRPAGPSAVVPPTTKLTDVLRETAAALLRRRWSIDPALRVGNGTSSSVSQQTGTGAGGFLDPVSVNMGANMDAISVGNRVAFYQQELARSILFYPLVIEEQLLRAPSVASGLDSKRTAKQTAARLFPACSLPTDPEREEALRHSGMTQHVERDVRLLSQICSGSIPGTLTLAGKVLYVTESMHRSAGSRRLGRIRGCLRPWVHGCSHWTGGSEMYAANAGTELRLDHHQFRSFQRRSFSLPKWRGGPVGYPSQYNDTILQTYLTSIPDFGKLRFVPELRRRLLDFHPLPATPQYNLTEDPTSSIYLVERDAFFRRCTPLELLGQHQVMCPKEFPYVGVQMVAQALPNPFLPYAYCADRPPNTTHGWSTVFRPHAETESAEAFHAHVVLCAGFGEIRCCDYDATLEHLSTNQFPAPSRLWRRPVYQILELLLHP